MAIKHLAGGTHRAINPLNEDEAVLGLAPIAHR